MTVNAESVSLVSAFAIGFTIGIVTALKLLEIAERVIRSRMGADKHSIDDDGSRDVDMP